MELEKEEWINLKSHFVISSWGGVKKQEDRPRNPVSFGNQTICFNFRLAFCRTSDIYRSYSTKSYSEDFVF